MASAATPAIGTVSTGSCAPRILYAIELTPGEKFGSSEDQLDMIAQALKCAGGECVALFSTRKSTGSLDDFTNRGIASACVDLTRFKLATLRSILWLIDEHKIEAVHWNLTSPLRNPYLWALKARRPQVKHLYSDHFSRFAPNDLSAYFPSVGDKHLLGHGIAPKLWKVYAGVHCVSDFVRKELVKRTGISHATTLLHFVNTVRFSRDDVARERVRREHGLGDSITLLFMGLLVSEKGGHIAIRALARLKGNVTLLIAGSGPEDAKWRKLAEDLGVADRVRFAGLVRHPCLYFNAADIVVAPALWMEAAGFVNLEAQASGLPVVASRIGGIPEYLVEGKTGFLFEPGNEVALADLVQGLVDDPDLRHRMGRAALSHARQAFSPEGGTANILAWYRQTLGYAPATAVPADVDVKKAAS